MNLHRSIAGVAVVALLAGGALFSFGVSSSAAQTSDADPSSPVLAATDTASTTVEELKEQIEELQEQNEEYKETIDEQKETISSLREKLENASANEEKEREKEKEQEQEQEEEMEEKDQEFQEKAQELKKEAQEKAKEVKKKAQELKKEFMKKAQGLMQMTQTQKGKANTASGQQEEKKEQAQEQEKKQAQNKIMEGLREHFDQLPQPAQQAVSNFVDMGADQNTESLGAGERAAVMKSFQQAYGQLPQDDEQMARALMIANGRFPDKESNKAETWAKKQFTEVYNRIPNMNNPTDKAAVMTMAYGLRQQAQNRNLESEQKGLSIYKNIFGHLPNNTKQWNVMQAITYSGATKKEDADEDLLPDAREEKLGTKVNEPDTDGDGYKDGIEVMKGHDPLK